MSNEPVLTATLPAGTYVIGDPCYSIGAEQSDWIEWLEAADFRHPSREHVLVAPYKGHLCVGIPTAHGDGEYADSEGNFHPVDAGLIGLVAIEAADTNALGDGRVVVTFDEPVECFYNDGNITLGPITIQTNDVWECDTCGEPCEDGAAYCSDCEDWEEWTCVDCGEDVEEGDEFCGVCLDIRAAEDEG